MVKMKNILKINDIDLIIFSLVALVYWLVSHDIAMQIVKTLNLAAEPRYFMPKAFQYQLFLHSLFGLIGLILVARNINIKRKSNIKISVKYYIIIFIVVISIFIWLYTALKIIPQRNNFEQNNYKNLVVEPIKPPREMQK